MVGESARFLVCATMQVWRFWCLRCMRNCCSINDFYMHMHTRIMPQYFLLVLSKRQHSDEQGEAEHGRGSEEELGRKCGFLFES